VVRRRRRVEVRDRAERTALEDQAPFAGDTRIGPYLVPPPVAVAAARRVSIEGFDDRLHRRVWIEQLPDGSAPLAASRRDLGRPARVRWLGGKRQADDCWDAYEAVDGVAIDEAAATAQPWSRVRHWLSDLAAEFAAGLDDGSLPPLRPAGVWIGRDDRARVVEWSKTGSDLARIEGEPADLASAQRLLYGVGVAALLGVSVDKAMTLPPDTPLPLPARALLLSLRSGTFTTPQDLLQGVSAATAAPARYARGHRGGQIAVTVAFPLIMSLVAVAGVIWIGRNKALMPDASDAFSLATWAGLWLVALAAAAGSFVIPIFFAVLGALVTGSGFTFRPFGAALVNRRGQRASRFRALWRAAVTWAPMVVVLIVIKASPEPPNYRVSVLALETVLMVLIAGAAVWAVYHPSRSIQDRLAGTWIVPR
jgi:hypothetical protein